MKVLMLTWEYPPHLVGGMGRHVADLVPALDAAGVAVTVLTPWLRGGAEREPLGQHSEIVRVETPAMPEYSFISFVQETNRILEERAQLLMMLNGPFDLIHGHDWLTAYASVGLKYAWRRPLITTIHATERGRGRGRAEGDHARTINGLEWWITHESWRVIVCSQFMAGQLGDFFSTPRDKISVINNGVRVPELSWEEQSRADFRAQYAHPSEALVFSVARLVHEKGMHTLIEAIPRVLAANPAVKFVLAGVGHQLDFLQQRCVELGITACVFFTGFVPDQTRDRLYTVADVAVFPSLYEPFGIVALEAMANHCPVVVSDTGGLSEVVQLHDTGLKTFPDNPDSLAWGILHTLNHPEWSAKRADHACAVVETLYTWQTIARQTQHVYVQISRECASSLWQATEERPDDA